LTTSAEGAAATIEMAARVNVMRDCIVTDC
jgi:hypothetical protein